MRALLIFMIAVNLLLYFAIPDASAGTITGQLQTINLTGSPTYPYNPVPDAEVKAYNTSNNSEIYIDYSDDLGFWALYNLTTGYYNISFIKNPEYYSEYEYDYYFNTSRFQSAEINKDMAAKPTGNISGRVCHLTCETIPQLPSTSIFNTAIEVITFLSTFMISSVNSVSVFVHTSIQILLLILLIIMFGAVFYVASWVVR